MATDQNINLEYFQVASHVVAFAYDCNGHELGFRYGICPDGWLLSIAIVNGHFLNIRHLDLNPWHKVAVYTEKISTYSSVTPAWLWCSSLTVFQREVWWHLPLLAVGVSCFLVAFRLVFAVLRSRRDRKVERILAELYRDLWDARQLKQDDPLKFVLVKVDASLQAQKQQIIHKGWRAG